MGVIRIQAHADWDAVVRVGGPSDKRFVDTFLGLPAQIAVNACADDDEFVASVSGLRDDAGVIGCLARLDVADDQAAPVS
jgi:hypothetical protein